MSSSRRPFLAASRVASVGNRLFQSRYCTLADGEINFDGVDSGNGGHRPAARIDQSTHLKLSLPSNAVDGRNEPSEIEVDPGRFNSGLSRLNLSFGRGDGSFRRQIVLDGIVEILLAGSLLLASGV